MSIQIHKIFKNSFTVTKDINGIWGSVLPNDGQSSEHKLREDVASYFQGNYLEEISKHHSIEVMDMEINRFLTKIPKNGIICDVGGCWGWHWRNIQELRPDVSIVIVDFSRANLIHASKLLNKIPTNNIYLVHAEATSLNFINECFDGFWTVQTFQHIPDVQSAINEAYRVLKTGGIFCNYALNNSDLNRLLFRLINKQYIQEGIVNDKFYIRRGSDSDASYLNKVFNCKVQKRYTEILFKPGIKIRFPGKVGSITGKIDSHLSGSSPFLKMLARQISFHTRKG